MDGVHSKRVFQPALHQLGRLKMRHPKPFFRKFTKSWYVTIKGRQYPLGPDRAEAWQKYHELMANRDKLSGPSLTVAAVFDAYLEWLQKHRSKGTYDKAVHYLSLFIKHVGTGYRTSTLDGTKVTEWIELYPHWSPSAGHDAVSIVQRAFNWAVRKRHLDRSPVQYVPDKPAKTRREIVYDAVQWDELRSHVKDQSFGDLLDFMWDTGCRPIEARTMEALHVDLRNDMVIFPPSEAKGEQHERVIFLTDTSKDICERRAKQWSTGPIMRNTQGRPWTKDAIGCRFQRLRQKLDRAACAYGIRHSFATEGLKSGMDSLTLAQLMGHQDTSMIAKTYSHLARNPGYLREQARKLKDARSK